MIKFKSITLQNFLSFGKIPTTVNLDTDMVSLIMGENKDVGSEGYSRNGVGKSTIFQAICWCLFNEGVTNIKQDAFINITNKKRMFVEIIIDIDGTELVIKRSRKPNSCEITKNGEPYTLHSSASNDESIKELLGMDIDIFLNTVLLTTNNTSFMGMKPAEQRNFMERILALHILSKRADKLKVMNRDNSVEIKLEEQNKEHVERTNDRIASSLRELESKSTKWITDISTQIEDNKSTIEDMESVDIEVEINLNKDCESFDKEIVNIESEIKYLEDEHKIKYSVINAEHEKKKSSIGSLYSEKKDKVFEGIDKDNDLLTSQYKEDQEQVNVIKNKLHDTQKQHYSEISTLNDIKNNITGMKKQKKSLLNNKCPYCEQPYHGEGKLEEINKELLKLNESYELTDISANLLGDAEYKLNKEYNESYEAVEDNYNILFKKLMNNRDNDINDLILKRDEALSEAYIYYTQKIESDGMTFDSMKEQLAIKLYGITENYPKPNLTLSECNEFVITLENLKRDNDRLKNESNPYIDQIDIMKKDIIDYDKSKMMNLIKNESHYKILIKLLTDSKSFVRKNLIDQYVPFINQKINDYLEDLESPHKVNINSDLTVDVNYMKQNISFGNLSNGEKLRVNLATSFAFRELLSLSGCNNNLLLIDELLDSGGDSSFFYNVFKVLKSRSSESVFIISHREELIPEVDELITIQKEGGFSRINP